MNIQLAEFVSIERFVILKPPFIVGSNDNFAYDRSKLVAYFHRTTLFKAK